MDFFKQWATAYRRDAGEGTELLWPSETLVRLFKGNYVPGHHHEFRGRKVLEVGFGNGNNLIFLASLGLQLYGTEVHEDICHQVSARLEEFGCQPELKVGTNRQLPFPDNFFDYLVSWNVIHYEEDTDRIREAIAEYARVLKRGGRIFVSTTGPDHKILDGSTVLENHRYRIGRGDDFRQNWLHFSFDNERYVRHHFSSCFDQVVVGRIRDFLFTETLDWFLVSGVKTP